MDPSTMTIFDWIMHGGVPALSLVLLYLLAKHHVRVLSEHRKDERALAAKLEKLESDYRSKIEELLKDQVKWVEKISNKLAESSQALEAVREELDKS